MTLRGSIIVTLFALVAVTAWAQSPRVLSVEPDTGKQGDELVVSGQNLDCAVGRGACLWALPNKGDPPCNVGSPILASLKLHRQYRTSVERMLTVLVAAIAIVTVLEH